MKYIRTESALNVLKLLCLVWFSSQEVMTSDLNCTCYNESSETGLRESILENIMSKYDKRFPPLYNSDSPVNVKVQMHIVGIFDVNEKEMFFSLSMYLRQYWNDPRLKYTKIPDLELIELDNEVMQKIWVPDLSFLNDISARFHNVSLPNRMMNLYPDGNVSYSIRVTGSFMCFMSLQNFPFDQQHCFVELESYGYSASVLRFEWKSPAATIDKRVSHSHFKIYNPTSYVCDQGLVSGNFSCIGLSIPLKRRYGFYLIQVYGPSMLVVILSWVSFWLNIDAIPARVSLGILTVLTLTSSGHMSIGLSQHVSYIRAIDVWNAVCLILVFAAVLEYAYICVAVRVEYRRRASSVTEQRIDKVEAVRTSLLTYKEHARITDKVSRVVFPLTFLSFNLVYWVFYLT